jgi:hypothetical protein
LLFLGCPQNDTRVRQCRGRPIRNPQEPPGCPQVSTEFSTASYRAVRANHGLSPDLMRLMSSLTCS